MNSELHPLEQEIATTAPTRTASPAEQIAQNMSAQIRKMNENTIQEYRELAKAILAMKISVEKDAEAILGEIDAHIAWLHGQDEKLTTRVTNHVSFVNDALQAKALIADSFRLMRERYESPAP